MNILYIGSGFVGACSAAVSADSGHRVVVYDVDQVKINKLRTDDRDEIKSCLFEEGLPDLIIRNRERIEFTTDYAKVESFLDSVDAVFMCLPTPEIGETGESDLSYYISAAERLAGSLSKRNNGAQTTYVVIVNKSTVPIAMIDRTKEIMDAHGVIAYGVVSNPEFLVEGKAIQGSLHPDRVVVGARSEKDFEVMRTIYRRFYDSSAIEYIEVGPEEASAGKLLANFYLFNKLAVCFDIIGRTCEAFPNLNFEHIRSILVSDPRIGSWGLYDSLYAGGSCFVKDARSLAHQLEEQGKNAVLVRETYHANRRQLELFLERSKTDAGFEWEGASVTVLGVAFKQDTNDVRNSPSIDIVRFLLDQGVRSITLYDPVAMDMFQNLFAPDQVIQYATQLDEAIGHADAVIVATDWPQFRGIADTLLTNSKKSLIMDGRRMLQHAYSDLVAVGFSIIAVGSPYMHSSN